MLKKVEQEFFLQRNTKNDEKPLFASQRYNPRDAFLNQNGAI